jgi:hypothetical protein
VVQHPQTMAAPADPSVASTIVKSYADVLWEASTTMLRIYMLRILQERLIDTVSDKTKMEQLF